MTCLARELVAVAAVICSAPLEVVAAAVDASPAPERVPAASGVPDEASRPIVLVHGFAASRASWFALQRALRADDLVVETFDYPPWARSVDELADRLCDTVEDLLAITGADKVQLVGHSLGGVVIAQALTRGRLAERVDLVVTLGSPFGGTPWAGIIPLSPLIWSLRPGSPLLRRLAAAAPPSGVRWLAFTSTLDHVVPGSRAVPSHTAATHVSVPATGHSGILLVPDVITRIVAAVTDAESASDASDLTAA